LQDTNKNTAVLVFIRQEKEDAQVKKISKKLGFKAQQRAFTWLNQHVLSVTKKSGLPTFVIKGHQQIGNSFGERLTNSIHSVFSDGYENIIAIGNDCLDITPSLLRQTAVDLENQKVVLGPANDGGVYLLGFQKSVFDVEKISALPWQTPQLFQELQQYFSAENHFDFSILSSAIDIDDEWTFIKVLNQFHSYFSIKKQLQALLLAVKNSVFRYQNIFQSYQLKNSHLLRGPPVY